MNKPNPAPEPTMEEILASIRRIISDGDDTAAPAAAPAATAPNRGPEPVPAPDDVAGQVAGDAADDMPDFDAIAEDAADADADIFDLTDDMVADEPDEDRSVAAEPEAEMAAGEQDAETALGVVDPDDVFAMADISEDESSDEELAVDGFPAVPAMAEPIVDPDSIDLAFDEPVTSAPPAPASTAPASTAPKPTESASMTTESKAPEPEAAKPAAEEIDPAPATPPKPEKDTASAGHSGLLSPQSDAMVASAFGRLANTMLSQDPRTLEDLVGEMLRPMLKDWLDDNLPVLVERLVREEIERVSRGNR